MNKYKIAIGGDHIVYSYKKQLIEELQKQGHTVIDVGTYNEIKTHYPIYGYAVSLLVVEKKVDFGIAFCGTGVGISNSANKVKGARCILTSNIYTVKKARSDWDANILSFGGRVIGMGVALEMIDVFLNTKYENKNIEEIERINQQLKNLTVNKKIFHKYIESWEKGEYTQGEKQKSVSLPQIDELSLNNK